MGSIYASGVGGGVGGVVGWTGSTTPADSYIRDYVALSSITTSGISNVHGFIGLRQDPSTFTNVYLYDNAGVPSDSFTGLTSYKTSTQMQTQSNFAFDFSTPVWKMPSANPLSPTGLLSPVHYWLCGTNGVVCP